MRIICLLLAFLFVSSIAYAEFETYLKEYPDGSVSVLYYKKGTSRPLQEMLEAPNADGISPVDAVRVNASDFPADRADRKYWKRSLIGKKIKIDDVQKQLDQDAKDAEKLAKKGILSKLCNNCTDQEWEEIGLL